MGLDVSFMTKLIYVQSSNFSFPFLLTVFAAKETELRSANMPNKPLKPSAVGLDDYDDSDKSLLPKPSPPEVVHVTDEQLSPAVDYPDYLTTEMQIKVGLSPTEEDQVKDTIPKYIKSQIVQQSLDEEEEADLASVQMNKGFSKEKAEVTSEIKKDKVERRKSVEKQIVHEMISKELVASDEEITSGSLEKKVLSKESSLKESEETVIKNHKSSHYKSNLEEIKKEAVKITESIVDKAKEELSKRPKLQAALSEFSDEDLVEIGDHELSPHILSPTSIDPSILNQQKRISFTEHDTYLIKEESEDHEDVSLTQVSERKGSRPSSSDHRKSADSERLSGSGSRSSGSRRDKGTGSSSEYHSFEVSTDSSRTPISSRPNSSEFDLAIIPGHSSRSGSGTVGLSSSEYETCATSQECSGSYVTATSPYDTSYETAKSSFTSETSSRESTISIESESSLGRLGEISSEASETIIPGEDKDARTPVPESLDDDDDDDDNYDGDNDDEDDDNQNNGDTTPINDYREPYETKIPEHVIRSGVEVPFMGGKNWQFLQQKEQESIAHFEQELKESESYQECSSFESRPQLEHQNISIEESEHLTLSDNSTTCHSSIATAIYIPDQESSIGQMSSYSESIGSSENNQSSSQPQSLQSHQDSVDSNDAHEVDDSGSSGKSNSVLSRHQSNTSQDTNHSSSDLGSDVHMSTLMSQSSLASSLSEKARNQLSYDLSPEVGVSPPNEELPRPESPVPPEEFNYSYGERCDDDFHCERSDLTSDLYTHPEIDEELETSSSQDVNLILKGRPLSSLQRSGESSAASSLKEFERLEAELTKTKESLGSSDSLGSHGKPYKEDTLITASVTESLIEFEMLEKESIENVNNETLTKIEKQLSGIEEGHESQASQETLSNGGHDDKTDFEYYDKKMSEIDDIMRQSQNNAEKFFNSNLTDKFEREPIDSTESDLINDKLSHLAEKHLTEPHKTFSKNQILSGTKESHKVIKIDNENLLQETEHDIDSLNGDNGNQTPDPDSLQNDDLRDRDPDCDSLQDLELSTDNLELSTDNIESDTFSHKEPLEFMTMESSGPALSTISEGQDEFSEDSLRQSYHGFMKNEECMLSSTDSLEPSYSIMNTSYHREVMTSSAISFRTSADESMMMSSTSDTFECSHPSSEFESIKEEETFKKQYNNEAKLKNNLNNNETVNNESQSKEGQQEQCEDEYEEFQTFDEQGNLKTFRRVKRVIKQAYSSEFTSTNEAEERFHKLLLESTDPPTEQIIEERSFDEKGNIIVKRTIDKVFTAPPQVQSKHVKGAEAETETSEFIKSHSKYGPQTKIEEYEGIDESGNEYRVYQEITVKPEVRAVTFTGPDAEEKLKNFMKNWSGDKNDLVNLTTSQSSEESSGTIKTY